MADLLAIRLVRNHDASVTGALPDGQVIHWPLYVSNRPTRRNRRVMVNCSWWKPVWEDLNALRPGDPLLHRNPVRQ